MSVRFAARVRGSIARSPVLQILLFIVITFAVLLLAEYAGLLGA
jgi:hypothetical protein